MKRYSLVYLLEAALVALTGCASVSDTRPPFGSYTTLETAKLDDHKSAVDILTIKRNGTGGFYSPGSDTIWLRPGHYMAMLRCNRAYKTTNGTEMQILGTADGPEFNFEFDIDERAIYQLDCNTSDHGQHFDIYAMPVSAIGERHGSPDPGTATPAPDPGNCSRHCSRRLVPDAALPPTSL